MRLRHAAFRAGVHPVDLSPAHRAAFAHPSLAFAALYADVVAGRVDARAFEARSREHLESKMSRRAFTSIGKLAVEMWLLLGQADEALTLLGRVADAGLVDVTWLSRCPLLAPLWPRHEFAEIHRRTCLTAQGMWG